MSRRQEAIEYIEKLVAEETETGTNSKEQMIDLSKFLTKNDLEEVALLMSAGGGNLRASGISDLGSIGGDNRKQSFAFL